MDHRLLGRCGIEVSVLGYGAFKIGRNEGIKYAHAYPLPTDDEAIALVRGVVDLGLTYIDTAPAYGLSEERVGRAIADRRAEVVLSTKVGETFAGGRSVYDFTSAAVRASLARSLRRLRTDAVDVVFVHSDGRDLAILDETDVVDTLRDLRDRGDTRAIGFSGKTVEGARAALAWADAIMVEHHPLDRRHEPVIAEAAAAGIGVVVKKGLASGRLDPAEAIPFILDTPGVSSVVIGGLSLPHMRANVETASPAGTG